MKRPSKLPALGDGKEIPAPSNNPFKAPIDALLFQDKETIRVSCLLKGLLKC